MTELGIERGTGKRAGSDDGRNWSYATPGLKWLHFEDMVEPYRRDELARHAIPDVVRSALIASETRPRCDPIDGGALINLRGLAQPPKDSGGELVSIRLWVQQSEVISVSRFPLEATKQVCEAFEAGNLKDPGDLVTAYARSISAGLDPEVAAMGDLLDDCESELESRGIYELRRRIAVIRSDAIAYRRFVSPNRDALTTLSQLNLNWLSDEDRLHIREAADRFARMTEELESIRERAALLHEQLTDMRAELMDRRNLEIAIVAFIFLPLTFVTGLLGMNVDGIPFAHRHWAFWGVVGFCVIIGALVLAWFFVRRWISR